MSKNDQENSSVALSIDDYIECAVDIQIANEMNGKQMDQLFQEIVNKAKQYRNQCQIAEAEVETLKKVLIAQMQKIHSLRDRLDEMSKKLKLAESMAQTNELKYNRIYNKLKAIVLDSAAESCNNDNNNAQPL